jgi:dihydrofolate reductase
MNLWARLLWGSRCRSMVSSPGPMMAPNCPWARVASGSLRGTPAGGNPPLGVPTFVVSHTVPQEWVYEGSPFTFVTEGVESAVEQARAVAGDKDVAVGAASIVQQCLRAGLLDEIHLDLVPVLLGDGVRLFEHLGTGPIELESTQVIEGAGVTHLTFRVVK